MQVLVGNASMLRPGDWFYLSTGNFGATPSAANVSQWASQIHAVDPGGIFVVHTGGIANVNTLFAQGLSSLITWFSLDEEPNEPGFSGSQTTTAFQLANFTAIVHSHGLKSIGYMTGQGIYGDSSVNKWNYSAFAAVVDYVTVQTQGNECVAGGNGPTCVSILAGQFMGAGDATSDLSVQATVGSLADGVTVTLTEVMSTLNASVRMGFGPFFLEFTGATAPDLIAVLQADGR